MPWSILPLVSGILFIFLRHFSFPKTYFSFLDGAVHYERYPTIKVVNFLTFLQNILRKYSIGILLIANSGLNLSFSYIIGKVLKTAMSPSDGTFGNAISFLWYLPVLSQQCDIRLVEPFFKKTKTSKCQNYSRSECSRLLVLFNLSILKHAQFCCLIGCYNVCVISNFKSAASFWIIKLAICCLTQKN